MVYKNPLILRFKYSATVRSQLHLKFKLNISEKEIEMKRAMIIGACLLLAFTIVECINKIEKKQDNCGDPTDTSTELGKCFEAAKDNDIDVVCGECRSVLEDYAKCEGIDVDDTECGALSMSVAVFSTATALVIAVTAALN